MSDIESSFPAPATPAPPAAPPAPEPDSTVEQDSTPEGETTPEATLEAKLFTQAELNKHIQERLHKESRRTEKLVEARLRAEYAERQLAELKAPPRQEASGEPKPQDFKDYETYISARVKFDVDQQMAGVRQQTEVQRQAESQRQAAARILPKLKSATEKYEDFQEVATSFSAPDPMQAAMVESDIPGELYYYLGSNPAELDRIAALTPVGQVREIAKLEAKLNSSPSTTRTPAPIVPNGGRSPVAKPLSELSQSDFDERRRKYIARKR